VFSRRIPTRSVDPILSKGCTPIAPLLGGPVPYFTLQCISLAWILRTGAEQSCELLNFVTLRHLPYHPSTYFLPTLTFLNIILCSLPVKQQRVLLALG
jgi:hypothetical protein